MIVKDTETLPISVNKKLEKLLVGGAVRDMIMGMDPDDRDWLVINQTPQSMLDLGFIRPSKKTKAPVFLHPKDILREEYALPRLDESTGPEYGSFDYKVDDVTVEEDLARRDITINAMALKMDGTLIDPFNGLADITNKTIRAVRQSTFTDDPLRLLRVCRFAARFMFEVDQKTSNTCTIMGKLNMIKFLSKDRIYKEFKKAFKQCAQPSLFIRWLKAFHILDKVAPEIEKLVGVKQVSLHHGEGDAFEHSLLVLDEARNLTKDHRILIAALCHDLGKAETPKEEWPSHHRHEGRGENLLQDLCSRLGVETKTWLYSSKAMKLHMKFHKALEMTAGHVKKLLDDLKVRNRYDVFDAFLVVGQADGKGRIPPDRQTKVKVQFLVDAAKAYNSIKMDVDNDKPLSTRLQMMTKDMVTAIKKVRKNYPKIGDTSN